MATKVFMEALSPTMEEGRLAKWLKNEGDAVKNGDVLAEVETDKAIMELVARGEGILRKRLLADGATSPVGALIGIIAKADENIDALVGGAPSPAAAAPAAPATAPAAAAAPPAAPPAPPSAPTPAPAPVAAAATSGRQRSSPLARRLASERGIDIGHVQGSGPGGRIVKRDIEAAPAGATNAPSAAPAAPRLAAPAGAGYRDVPLTQIRKTIARRLAESIGPVPTFYLTAEVDMERVAEMRAAMAELGDAYKVSFNDVVLKAVATALHQHPECNAHWLGDAIRYFDRVHLGMAVAIPDGLITPVIFDAHLKRLSEIAAESRDLAARARER
ncbi:MAG: 2-oxo acid dehydrogenase subunit E2, partial [Gemmatimonadetes bacterium]|nr:2-oxo acid dehydrogenase subunit E2 [Gemmatimonadota bacterium]